MKLVPMAPERAAQTDLILNQLRERVANKDRDIEILRKDGQNNAGTLIFSEIRQALSDIPANRLGGIFIILAVRRMGISWGNQLMCLYITS